MRDIFWNRQKSNQKWKPNQNDQKLEQTSLKIESDWIPNHCKISLQVMRTWGMVPGCSLQSSISVEP